MTAPILSFLALKEDYTPLKSHPHPFFHRAVFSVKVLCTCRTDDLQGIIGPEI